MTTIVWFEGKILPPNTNVISPLAHGFTVGDGVFETIAMRRLEPFALQRHMTRLQDSLARIGLLDLDPGIVVGGIRAVVDAGQGKLTRLRVTVAGGPGPLGTERVPAHPYIVVAGSDSPLRKTCEAVRVPWRRNEYSPLVGIKATSWGDQVLIRVHANDRGADEALLANTQGHLCEGTGTNVFIEMNGEIVTPPLASGCLPGIARSLALEWGAAAGLPIRAADAGELMYEVLDEVFQGEASAAVTSVTRGVQPVATLDGAQCRPGPLLAKLREVFEAGAAREQDPPPSR
ncbi:MAG: aminotransferase class IV [Demequinaceae bacterium]|nr:aminotransferase class IV [Demequinaceae bacterium]